jgi:hypothetical protein
MPRRIQLLVSFPIALSLLAPASIADGKSDFDSALVQVRRMMDARKWKEAKALLGTTLDAHANQTYVRERLDDLREILRACSFELAYPRRDVKSLFCGEVASYDAKSGEISLRWDKTKAPKGDAAKNAFPCEDFESTSWGSVLRVPFDGPHLIEISGKAIGQKVPVIRVCIEGDRSYEVKLDAGSMCSIDRMEGKERTPVASSTNFYNVQRPYTLKVAVRDTQIDASHNGTRMVLGEKSKEDCGRLGFHDVLDPQKIEVRGKVRTAWIDEQIKALADKDKQAFDKAYDPGADLPAWLRH